MNMSYAGIMSIVDMDEEPFASILDGHTNWPECLCSEVRDPLE